MFELIKEIKHVPLRLTSTSDFIVETRKDEITGLFYATYEQDKSKYYDCTFMLDELRDAIKKEFEQ